MRKSLHVRPARADDWPAVANCFAQAGLAAWSQILPRESLLELRAPERWQTAVYRNSLLGSVLVVETEGTVIGFSVLRPSEDEDALPLTGEVDAFYTSPHFWGKGAGIALMHETVARAKEMGFLRLTLWTEERNSRPRRFYQLAGWRDGHGIRKRDFGGYMLTEVRYLKDL